MQPGPPCGRIVVWWHNMAETQRFSCYSFFGHLKMVLGLLISILMDEALTGILGPSFQCECPLGKNKTKNKHTSVIFLLGKKIHNFTFL